MHEKLFSSLAQINNGSRKARKHPQLKLEALEGVLRYFGGDDLVSLSTWRFIIAECKAAPAMA